jgi:hypothetical protein
MAQNSSGDQASAGAASSGSTGSSHAGVESLGKPTPSTTDKKEPVMDIRKYAQKAKLGKSISGLLEVIFKGTLAKESEWSKKVKDAVERQAKK